MAGSEASGHKNKIKTLARTTLAHDCWRQLNPTETRRSAVDFGIFKRSVEAFEVGVTEIAATFQTGMLERGAAIEASADSTQTSFKSGT